MCRCRNPAGYRFRTRPRTRRHSQTRTNLYVSSCTLAVLLAALPVALVLVASGHLEPALAFLEVSSPLSVVLVAVE